MKVKALAIADYIGIEEGFAGPLDEGMMLSLLQDIDRLAGVAS